MVYNVDNNSDNGTNSSRNRFGDRIKKIRKDRFSKKKVNNDDLEEGIIKQVGRNVFKIFLALPSLIYSVFKGDNIVVDEIDSKQLEKNIDYLSYEKKLEIKKIKVKKIKDIDVALLKRKKKMLSVEQNQIKNNIKTKNNDNKNDGNINEEKELKIVKLQKEIIDLIKKRLVKNINELEILQSELYLLKEFNIEDIYLKKCQEDIKNIKKLISKVNSLKEKYDYLKDNFEFEYMLEFNDDLLDDKILELKSLCTNEDIKYVIDNYKLLDEYKFLYLKIDNLQESIIKYEDFKNNKADELKQRDIDFDKFKNKIFNIDKENDKYDNFVREQEIFLNNLNSKLLHVDAKEDITYRLKGFNQLLGNSFKYLSLLCLSPLKSFLPGIATQTLVTKNIINNLYNNLEWEVNKKMVYETIDYSSLINSAIHNLDLTVSMINSSLEDIVKLKDMYKKRFSSYEYSFSGYKDAIKKLNRIENTILGNKIKIENMRIKMRENEKQNISKLKMVKKLNSSMNN